MAELVQDLRARGWRVVIVTASPTWIVEPGARRLGLGPEDVLGIEVSQHQCCTRYSEVRYCWYWAACSNHHVRNCQAHMERGRFQVTP